MPRGGWVRFGVVVAVVAAVAAAICWHQQEDAIDSNIFRRTMIERTRRRYGVEDALIYAAGVVRSDDDVWRAAAVAFGAVSLMGAGLAWTASGVGPGRFTRRESPAAPEPPPSR